MKGSIVERSPGHWGIILNEAASKTQNGKRRRRWFSFQGTKREAQRECARLIAELQNGTAVEPTKLTVAEFLDRFERDWIPAHVRTRTAIRYVQLLKHVRARLGGLPIQKLRPVNLSELYAALLREGLAPRTVGHVHRVTHRALGQAKKWDVVKDNIAASVSPPRVPRKEVVILHPAEAKAALDVLRGKSLYLIAAMALATGMRRNELLALRWQDVDLDAASLRVVMNLEQTKQHGIRLEELKTAHSRRSIALPSYMVAELRAHWKAQQEQRMALGMGRSPEDSPVLATFDGRFRSPNAVTKEWTREMAAAGLPKKVTLHSLRHTHASTLIASGMDILTISRRLGHANPTITLNIYGHLLSHTDGRAAEIMDAAFSGRTS
jgi:integrase